MQLVTGWDFTQKQGYYGSNSFKHWAFRNNYYIRTNFVLRPNVQLSTFYQGESYIEVPQFRSNVFWETIWLPSQNLLCLQLGWNSDAINLNMRTSFNL